MVRAAEVSAEYICCICGTTLKECKHWGPICKKTGRRVCDACCYKCEYRVSWSGIWRCGYLTPEDKRAAAVQRIRDREQIEIRKISEEQRRRQLHARARTSRGRRK